MVMRDEAPHDEEFESIPWDTLIDRDARRTRRWVVLGGVILLVAAIATSAARTMWPASSNPIAVPVVDSSAIPPPVKTTTLEQPSVLYSEADLMAVDAESLTATASAHAEWFVAEFFTLDGTGRSPLLDDVTLPGAEAHVRSFVEDTHAIAVEPIAQGEFHVTVVFRSLSASGDGEYRRQPARAVKVEVAVTEDGVVIGDVPGPVILPVVVTKHSELTASPVDPVWLATAREHAAGFGTPDPEPVSVMRSSDGSTRFLLLVRDGEGVGWPLAVWLDEAGDVIG